MKKKPITKEQLEAWIANVEAYRDGALAQWIADAKALDANMVFMPEDSGNPPTPPDPPLPPHH